MARRNDVRNKILTKKEIIARDGPNCFYCESLVYIRGWYPGKIELPDDATIDHIIAHSEGGSNELDNLILACRECNEERGTKLAGLFLLYKRNLKAPIL